MRTKKWFLNGDLGRSMPRIGRVGRSRRPLRDPDSHAGGVPPAPVSPPAPAPVPPAPAPDPNAEKKFTQTDLNRLMAEQKRDHKAQTDKQIADLQELRDSKGQSDDARAKLSVQISDLQNSQKTAEEIARGEKEQLTKEHKEALAKSDARADENWRRYEAMLKANAVTSAASKHEAYRNEHVEAIVAPLIKLVPVEENGEVVRHDAVVPATVKKEDGTTEAKDLTVDEYVERMKSDPNYANLFVSKRVGGSGHQPGSGVPVGQDPANMTKEEKIQAGLKARFPAGRG